MWTDFTVSELYFSPERLKGWQRKNKGFPTLVLTDHPLVWSPRSREHKASLAKNPIVYPKEKLSAKVEFGAKRAGERAEKREDVWPVSGGEML